MVNRFAFQSDAVSLSEWTDLIKKWPDRVMESYNIAPTSPISVYTATGWRTMRWSFVPKWSKHLRPKYSMHNVRASSVDTKPAFRPAWRNGQRCLIPAIGYYIWKMKVAESMFKKLVPAKEMAEKLRRNSVEIPYFVRSAYEHEPMVFAGIWERWRDAAGETALTCAMLTRSSETPLSEVSRRQPVIIPAAMAERWLFGSIEDVSRLISEPTAVDLCYYRVETAINSFAARGPQLLEPIDVDKIQFVPRTGAIGELMATG